MKVKTGIVESICKPTEEVKLGKESEETSVPYLPPPGENFE